METGTLLQLVFEKDDNAPQILVSLQPRFNCVKLIEGFAESFIKNL